MKITIMAHSEKLNQFNSRRIKKSIITFGLICFFLFAILEHQQQQKLNSGFVSASPVPANSLSFQNLDNSIGENNNNNAINQINKQQQQQQQQQQQIMQSKKFADLDDFFSNLLEGENRLKKSKNLYRPAKQTLRFGKRSDPSLSSFSNANSIDRDGLTQSMLFENYLNNEKASRWPE